MLHAAYEESATRVPAVASGSMRPLAAAKQGSVPWLLPRYAVLMSDYFYEYTGTYPTEPDGLVRRRIPRWCLIHEELENGC